MTIVIGIETNCLEYNGGIYSASLVLSNLL